MVKDPPLGRSRVGGRGPGHGSTILPTFVWSKGGLPYLEEPALPRPVLYFQEYLIIGALASAAHSWVDPSYTFTFWYPKTSERTYQPPEQSRPVSQ